MFSLSRSPMPAHLSFCVFLYFWYRTRNEQDLWTLLPPEHRLNRHRNIELGLAGCCCSYSPLSTVSAALSPLLLPGCRASNGLAHSKHSDKQWNYPFCPTIPLLATMGIFLGLLVLPSRPKNVCLSVSMQAPFSLQLIK